MKVIFLDRDGVINRYPGDRDYVKSWQEFRFLPKVKTALKRLAKFDSKIFIISNQAGVSKGLYSNKTLNLITRNMLREFGDSLISGVYYCTHLEEHNCTCRKPKTGLIEQALKKIKKEGKTVRLKEGYLIGDTIGDIETGKNVGLKTILVFSGKEKPENKNTWRIQPDYTAKDLSEAVDIILKK